MNDENRVRKSWWIFHDNGVRKAVGYSCAPNNPDSWWFPEIGFTLNEKHHVFETETEAVRKASADIQAQIISLQKALGAVIGRKEKG